MKTKRTIPQTAANTFIQTSEATFEDYTIFSDIVLAAAWYEAQMCIRQQLDPNICDAHALVYMYI